MPWASGRRRSLSSDPAVARAWSARYDALRDVVRSRMTHRAFVPGDIPRAHVGMITRHQVMYRDESRVA